MALSDPIPVRFSTPADSGLASVSSRTGLSKAELTRIAVDQFLENVELTGEIVQRHVVAEQHVRGDGNTVVQKNSSTSQSAREPAKSYPKPKRGKKKP